MQRIAFVDDDESVLEELKLILDPLSNVWEQAFFTSGAEALLGLEEASPDAVVADMIMPGMDGAMLLGIVKECWPRAARIVLSGRDDLATAMRSVPTAHQFLTKPCDPATLANVIERAMSLTMFLHDERLMELVGDTARLPAVPETFERLTALLATPESSLQDAAQLVEEYPSICSKLFQLVNSGFFSLRAQVTSVEAAMSLLGITLVRNIVVGFEVFERLGKGVDPSRSSWLTSLRDHSAEVAGLAPRFQRPGPEAEAAFLAGLLHDVGKLILVNDRTAEFDRLVGIAKTEGRRLHEVELEALGVTHAEVGAYVLSLWGFSYPVVEAVAYHHSRRRISTRRFDPAPAVYAANDLLRSDLPAGQPPRDELKGWLSQFNLDDIDSLLDNRAG